MFIFAHLSSVRFDFHISVAQLLMRMSERWKAAEK